jgi:hypothetical protein
MALFITEENAARRRLDLDAPEASPGDRIEESGKRVGAVIETCHPNI